MILIPHYYDQLEKYCKLFWLHAYLSEFLLLFTEVTMA